MFLKDFELTEPPFGSAADPKFLYFGSEHREAISSLYLGKWGIYLTQVAPRCSMRCDGGLSAELG